MTWELDSAAGLREKSAKRCCTDVQARNSISFMEPLYNQDGSFWRPTKKDLEGFEKIKQRVFSQKQPVKSSLFDDDVIIPLLAAIAVLLALLTDGYAVRHGMTPLFFR